jgi:molybdopterin molybdotransferase
MLSVEAAQARLLALCPPLAAERLPLSRAHGRTLAHDVTALRTHPPFDTSAMDGYAVRARDVAALPAQLKCVGTSAAGERFSGHVEPGQAVRIYTGAPMPVGADCIIVQEDVTALAEAILVHGGPSCADAHIRRRGLDVREGAVVARRGDRLTPPRLGFLAAAGVTDVDVHRARKVELLACGDELRLPGTALGDDDIVATNGLMLAALLRHEGAMVSGEDRLVPDDRTALTRAVLASDADILVTIGGASVGDRDFVRAALTDAGTRIDFWKVAMKPGKPMMIGRRGDQLVIGLPGNPVSAYVCALLFLLPALRALGGNPNPLPGWIAGVAATALPAAGNRAEFLRARAGLQNGQWHVCPHDVQDSSMLSALAGNNALLFRPADSAAAPAGAHVSFLRLDA